MGWIKIKNRIEVKKTNKYTCKKCGSFIGELKDDGYYHYNPKCRFANNGVVIKITCRCGEEKIIK